MGSALQILFPGLKYMVVTYGVQPRQLYHAIPLLGVYEGPIVPHKFVHRAPQTRDLSNQGSCLCIMRISLPQFELSFYMAQDVIYYLPYSPPFFFSTSSQTSWK